MREREIERDREKERDREGRKREEREIHIGEKRDRRGEREQQREKSHLIQCHLAIGGHFAELHKFVALIGHLVVSCNKATTSQ